MGYGQYFVLSGNLLGGEWVLDQSGGLGKVTETTGKSMHLWYQQVFVSDEQMRVIRARTDGMAPVHILELFCIHVRLYDVIRTN